MSDWLYPLSSGSGRWFVDSTGHRYNDTSFASFRTMMSKPSKDDWWYLATNYRNVQIGDRIWCYYGAADGDLGVVGVALVRDLVHDEHAGTHDIHLDWKVTATRRLMKAPVPATDVRRFIARPRAAVQALDVHPQLVRQLLKAAGI
jgi:hypothetical protein